MGVAGSKISPIQTGLSPARRRESGPGILMAAALCSPRPEQNPPPVLELEVGSVCSREKDEPEWGGGGRGGEKLSLKVFYTEEQEFRNMPPNSDAHFHTLFPQ